MAIAAATVGLVLAGGAGAEPGVVTSAKGEKRADRVLYGGAVYTVNPRHRWASAIAVADGRILYVGNDRRARSLARPGAEQIDLNGKMVMPGIVDGHAHPIDGGSLVEACSLDFEKLTIPEFQAKIQDCLDATAGQEPNAWLEVEAWNAEETQPPGTVIRKDSLDALTTSRPIIVHNADGHKSLVNSRALQLAGITGSTPNPPGGVIEKDGGQPTGLLFENAQALVQKLVPKDSFKDRVRWGRRAYEDLAAAGVTSILDAAGGEAALRVYDSLRRHGNLTARTQVATYMIASEVKRAEGVLRGLARLRARYRSGLLRASTIKVFADGVLEFPAQTGALLRPYRRFNGKGRTKRGLLAFGQSTFNKLVTEADKRRFQVHVHAIGDRAVRAALNAFQAARENNNVHGWGRRHTIAHLQLIADSDIPRFRKLKVIPNMQTQWFQRDGFTIDAVKPYIGQRRFEHMYPARSLARAGAKLAYGSDWPVDPLFPFYGIERAVTRTAEDFYGYDYGPLNKRQRISLRRTIRAFTLNAAFQLRQDKKTGSLVKGKLADLIVLDRNLFQVPASEIYGTEVLLTLLGGRVVHRAPAL